MAWLVPGQPLVRMEPCIDGIETNLFAQESGTLILTLMDAGVDPGRPIRSIRRAPPFEIEVRTDGRRVSSVRSLRRDHALQHTVADGSVKVRIEDLRIFDFVVLEP